MIDANLDKKYLDIILNRLAVCRDYRPKFGQGGEGVSYSEFQVMYGTDMFYAWFGLDNPLMYAAHKAAGGITSVYRQLGLGSEEVFRAILQDSLGLSEEQSIWSYQQTNNSGRVQTLTLDGRVEFADIVKLEKRQLFHEWLEQACIKLDLNKNVAAAMQGAVMEVRQGYKSKDAKRQNADMNNAAQAYTKGYLPILIVLSNQIDTDILERYERGKWLVLRGITSNDSLTSTYAFANDIIGYDLASFFGRNTEFLRAYTLEVLENLLKADE